jgi:hypothetical protein
MMLRRVNHGSLLLAVLVSVVAAAPAVGRAEEKVVKEWRFAKDLQGWTLGGQIADLTVKGGVLQGRSTGSDPIIFSPSFEIPAAATQCLEIKMKATKGGACQLFWTETLQGKFGGFSQEKQEDFVAQPGGEFQVYRLNPFWQAAKKIIRLRLDPPSDGSFAIESIRIVDRPTVASSAKRWDSQAGWKGWRAWQEASAPVVQNGFLRVKAQGTAPKLISPLLNLKAVENPYLCVRMAAKTGSTGRVFCASSAKFGTEEMTFPLRADGKLHNYTLDMANLKTWAGQILFVGVQPTDVEGAEVAIESIELGSRPTGPAELDVTYFGKAEGVNRTGRPAPVICAIRNLGGDTAKDLVATLTVPAGVKIVGSAQQKIERLTRYVPQQVAWSIESTEPGKVELTVKLEGAGLEPAVAKAGLEFTPMPAVAKASYVPEPRPVKSKYDIGIYYFPGWSTMDRWRPIFDYPDRKPILGWYDEANPEIADWQIKWAVEHGINFFMVDWYWCKENRHLEHWVHEAYAKAKYKKYLKWCVMWANHNPPNTHSAEDWRKVTQYWIDNYFKTPEYYQIDGRPVVYIWAPSNIRRDVGGTEEATKLYAMSQEMARKAGLKGIYFAAMSAHHSPAECEMLKSEGYEAMTSYHGFELAVRQAGKRRLPFADVVKVGPELWKIEDQRASGLSYQPIVDTGWSSEPWHHSKAMVIHGRTPELFGQLCREAKTYADQNGKRIIALGPWNEWGEGSYIEPFTECGFDYLDQIRATFCEPGDYPPNLVPKDLGLGPYDLPMEPAKSAWQFDTDGKLEGWSLGSIASEVKDGLLVGQSVGPDPILQTSGLQIDAETTRYVKIRMRSDTKDLGQIYWATTDSQVSESNCVRLEVIGDGQFHDYVVDLGQSPQWRGLVTTLRIDPANRPGAKFAIDKIEFSKTR